jgi:sec-independent protein translocase protein TatA
MDFLGIGWEEILLILIVALLIFGPGRVVEIGRTLGKTVNAFKKAANEFSTQITTELDKPKAEVDKLKTELDKLKTETSLQKTDKDQHSDRVS